ncbi:MAG TPA: PAS domain-containing protein, partial [Myxococcaceae bacterium]|nr:PAS domain-containing protein [Myxococcaceae bacterium]
MGGSGAVVSCNPAAGHILGRRTEDLLGQHLVATSRFLHPDGSPWPAEEHPAVVAQQTRTRCDAVPMGLELPGGERRWLAVSARPLPREGTEGLELLAVYLTDITALEESRAEQQRRADAFSRLVENSPDLMVEVDDACRYVHVNQAFEAISLPRQLLLGQPLGRRGLPPEVGARWEEAARAALSTGQSQRLEFELREPRGDRTWDCRVFPVQDGGADLKTVFFTAREITEY